MQNIERELGAYGAKIEALEDDVRRMEQKLDSIIETLAGAKGGWRVLMAVGGASATLGGLVVALFDKFIK